MTDPMITEAVPAADHAGQLAGQSLALNLLGRLLYECPDAALLQSLADDAVFDEIPFAGERPEVQSGLSLLQQWTGVARGGQLDYAAVRADYTRLFEGPGKIMAPPWESAQIDGERLIFQEETLQVRAWYKRFGLQVERLYSEPDDHVGLELAFLAHLTQLALAADVEGNRIRECKLLAARREFLTEHAGKWVPDWCQQVIEHAQTDFFRGLAYVTMGVVAELVEAPEYRPTVEAA